MASSELKYSKEEDTGSTAKEVNKTYKTQKAESFPRSLPKVTEARNCWGEGTFPTAHLPSSLARSTMDEAFDNYHSFCGGLFPEAAAFELSTFHTL